MKTIGLVGFGTIGQRWAAVFAHHGFDVRVYDPDHEAESRFFELKDGLFADLSKLHGPATAPGAIKVFADMGAALAGVDYVQESGPEALELKQALLAEIENHVADDVIIASSSSALLITQMQAHCVKPQRVLLAHPFNPAHIMPLVELVGGEKTSPVLLQTARGLYDAIGKKPVILNREVTGHLALRLMGAMWREAIALARDGVASIEDIDRAFIYGPGPKWGIQGSFISNGLNAEGMADFLRKYGQTYEDIWADLGAATLDARTREALSTSVAHLLQDRETLRNDRDAAIVAMLKLLAERSPL